MDQTQLEQTLDPEHQPMLVTVAKGTIGLLGSIGGLAFSEQTVDLYLKRGALACGIVVSLVTFLSICIDIRKKLKK